MFNGLIEQIKREAEINKMLYEMGKRHYIDKAGKIISGVVSVKVANKINNSNPANPKDFYKGKIGAVWEYIKKPRYILTTVERMTPVFAAEASWWGGTNIGHYIAGTWNVLTNNCVNELNCK